MAFVLRKAARFPPPLKVKFANGTVPPFLDKALIEELEEQSILRLMGLDEKEA
jgi:hypothetical protein